jgi:hypothetical protein
MEELRVLGIANFAGKKKRDPQKRAEFTSIDRSGKYHMIGCKGNQCSSSDTVARFTGAHSELRDIMPAF